jgi:hypothetical protein
MNKQKNNHTLVHCVWGLACISSSIDEQSHNISLFNIIDQINLPPDFWEKNRKEQMVFPFQHQIVMLLRRIIPSSIDEKEIPFDLSIELIDPTGKPTMQFLSKLSFPAGKRRTYLRIGTPGFSLTEPGDYTYVLNYKSVEAEEFSKLGEFPLEVRQIGS